ncbi:hypothetical protein [Rhizobium sp. NXC24]|uniref:hypothetical protein n=1 Tax=Rhizobium sp. NXC24 TaxID=2048897 RepID=UPI00131A5C71|nr:hypothetical protein [Rhizobium sp. NXC24]
MTKSSHITAPQNNQGGGMFGFSWDAINDWSNRIYLIATICSISFAGIALLASFFMWRSSNEISADKDRELARFQAKANEKTEQLRNSSDQLKLEAIKLQERLEAERASRLQLQAALSSRHLSPEESDNLTAAVNGKLQRVVLKYTSDAESLAFAQDIANALARANVQVIPDGAGMIVPKPYGVSVNSPDPSPLTTGLRAANIQIQTVAYQGGDTWILVGEKPPPF